MGCVVENVVMIGGLVFEVFECFFRKWVVSLWFNFDFDDVCEWKGM